MVKDVAGNIWVSRSQAGVVSLLVLENGRVTAQDDIFTGLRNPHGLAIDPQDPYMLYIAQEDGVYNVPLYTPNRGVPEKLVDLPTGGRHTTRSLLVGADGRLYISIGSSCDVCAEQNQERAAIYVMNKDGSGFQPYATGLRNAVFIALQPQTGAIFATEMGRDFLGDNLPPDEINLIKEGKNYGWPHCYGQQVVDIKFDAGASCQNTEPALIDLPAHSAPLGLGFFDGSWGDDLSYNLLVAYHGSWNRKTPTGYKVVIFAMDKNGEVLNAEPRDFIAGWLTVNNQALGRPTGILIDNAGKKIYIADDKAGVIYRVEKID